MTQDRPAAASGVDDMEGHLTEDGNLEERRVDPNKFSEIREKLKIFFGENKKEIAGMFSRWQNGLNETMLSEFLKRKGDSVPSIRIRDAEGANGDFIEAGIRDFVRTVSMEEVGVRGLPAGRFNELVDSFSSSLFALIKQRSVEKRVEADRIKHEQLKTKRRVDEIDPEDETEDDEMDGAGGDRTP